MDAGSQVTGLGAVVIPVGMVLLIFAPRYIYIATIFFVPFTVASVWNSASNFPLVLGQYFGGLFILKESLVRLVSPERFTFQRSSEGNILLGFLMVAFISIAWPFLFTDGRRIVRLASGEIQTLVYDLHSVKGLLPVVFNIVLTIYIISFVRSYRALLMTFRIYVISGVFVTVWGYLEFFCHIFDVTYPAFLFNNARLSEMQGYTQIVNVGDVPIHRIASVFHEPSFLAKYLLTILPLLLIAKLKRFQLLGPYIDLVVLVAIVILLLLTTATTAYVGLVVVPAVVASTLIVAKDKARKWLAVMFICLVILAGLLYLYVPKADPIVQSLVLNKLSSGSGIERARYIFVAWQIFLEMPLFGAGWAMVTSHDLVVNLLANVGVVGFGLFAILIIVIYHRLIYVVRTLRNREGLAEQSMMAVALCISGSLTTLLIMSAITGAEFYLEYLYVILALASGVAYLGMNMCGLEKDMTQQN